MLKYAAAFLSRFTLLLAITVLLGIANAKPLHATDLPLAAGSPLAGITFDDRPLMLPVQRNFQMAMLTASSELGRSCGKMEAYGWRMAQNEQQRLNTIFNATVDRLRGLGYVVESAAPKSVSNDITIFTADKADKHFLFMWSAGEIGLAMVLCESSPTLVRTTPVEPSAQALPDVVQSKLAPTMATKSPGALAANFSPVGSWIGNYTCEQGYTGATFVITRLKGESFDGEFRFYPTAKNPYAAAGRYAVYGQYDRESHRILINPGKWVVHPPGYANTIMVGSFDPVERTFSAYFQGINTCTSFEARASDDVRAAKAVSEKLKTPPKPKSTKAVKKAKPKAVKPPTTAAVKVAPAAAEQKAPVTLEVGAPAPATPLTPPSPVPAPAATQPPAPATDHIVAPVSGAPAAPGEPTAQQPISIVPMPAKPDAGSATQTPPVAPVQPPAGETAAPQTEQPPKPVQ